MRVLMFGWEFPPYKSGGLGTACYGMGRALAKKGIRHEGGAYGPEPQDQ